VRVVRLPSARLINPRDGQVALPSDGREQPAAGEDSVLYRKRVFENTPYIVNHVFTVPAREYITQFRSSGYNY